METVGLVTADFWRGRRVLVTGHTGFKGGWLAAWLKQLGAEVTGLALAPETPETLFSACLLEREMRSLIGDIRDALTVERALEESKAEVVFHLAAQSLVRRSFRDPGATFAINVMGTVNVLEAIRKSDSVRAAVIVTTDKCYRNHGVGHGFREEDELGGPDPYSGSKACAELAVYSYAQAFFDHGETAVATARAGNVIGGGDFALDRIVPDTVRAIMSGEVLRVRNPNAIRPWQHVLEPLNAYLMLAERLYANGRGWSGPWNFGPSEGEVASVAELVELVIAAWGKGSWRAEPAADGIHEAEVLFLNSDKARRELGWRPRLSLREAVAMTAEWYRAAAHAPAASQMRELTARQIAQHQATR